MMNDDLISRQAAIEKLTSNLTYMHTFGADRSIDLIEDLPSAQPKRTKERTETHECDLISRQAAIDAIRATDDYTNVAIAIGLGRAMNAVRQLPSAEPETHEERTETHGVCLDTIDRQATLDWLKNEWNGMVTSLFDGIKAMPSAQPERKTGEWIKEHWHGEHTRRCSACNITQTVTTYRGKVNFNYCPYCGADMRGEQHE